MLFICGEMMEAVAKGLDFSCQDMSRDFIWGFQIRG